MRSHASSVGEIVEAITVVVPRKNYAGLVSHTAGCEAPRRGTSVPIQIAIRCVIVGVRVAPVVIATEAVTKSEASATMIAADVAACLVMQTLEAVTERHATTGEMASAKPAIHLGGYVVRQFPAVESHDYG